MVVLPASNEPPAWNGNPVYFWNFAALELNRLTHSLMGPQGGPTLSSRVLGILHLAIHDAYFAVVGAPPGVSTYLLAGGANPATALPPVAGAADARMAIAGAAITVLDRFYGRSHVSASSFSLDVRNQLDALLRAHIGRVADLDTLSSSYRFGIDVAEAMLGLLSIPQGDPGADAGDYRPKNGRYFFRDEPTHPVRLRPVDPNRPEGPMRAARVYHAPFYGMTARRFAIQADHLIADPPKDTPIPAGPPGDFGTFDPAEYLDAVDDVVRMGGAADVRTTRRRPDQTIGGLYWAYDGANLIGTPPRLYNQIVRKMVWERFLPATAPADDPARVAEAVRVFALVNAAMADAGIICWREKFCFEYWRPLTGIREHDPGCGPAYPGQPATRPIDGRADPFWRALGAPDTNTNQVAFKPPFPAYPSGHATFGAATFQILRRHYKDRDGLAFANDRADALAFEFVSDELDGVHRDLDQPYVSGVPITDQPGDVRTRVVRSFPSLWAAIFENAISRIWLGVHWRFDAFAAKDVMRPRPGSTTAPFRVASDGTSAYRDPQSIRYVTTGPRQDRPGQFPIGGVPLGIGIADDIYDSGLQIAADAVQPSGRDACAAAAAAATTGPGPAPARAARVVPQSSDSHIR